MQVGNPRETHRPSADETASSQRSSRLLLGGPTPVVLFNQQYEPSFGRGGGGGNRSCGLPPIFGGGRRASGSSNPVPISNEPSTNYSDRRDDEEIVPLNSILSQRDTAGRTDTTNTNAGAATAGWAGNLWASTTKWLWTAAPSTNAPTSVQPGSIQGAVRPQTVHNPSAVNAYPSSQPTAGGQEARQHHEQQARPPPPQQQERSQLELEPVRAPWCPPGRLAMSLDTNQIEAVELSEAALQSYDDELLLAEDGDISSSPLPREPRIEAHRHHGHQRHQTPRSLVSVNRIKRRAPHLIKEPMALDEFSAENYHALWSFLKVLAFIIGASYLSYVMRIDHQFPTCHDYNGETAICSIQTTTVICAPLAYEKHCQTYCAETAPDSCKQASV